jgi:hypothetical protein
MNASSTGRITPMSRIKTGKNPGILAIDIIEDKKFGMLNNLALVNVYPIKKGFMSSTISKGFIYIIHKSKQTDELAETKIHVGNLSKEAKKLLTYALDSVPTAKEKNSEDAAFYEAGYYKSLLTAIMTLHEQIKVEVSLCSDEPSGAGNSRSNSSTRQELAYELNDLSNGMNDFSAGLDAGGACDGGG